MLPFNLLSQFAGYYLSRASGLDKSLSTAICYEIGIHNSTLAIFVALSVLRVTRWRCQLRCTRW